MLAVAGCGKSPSAGPKSVADARAYAELPGLRRSPHEGLQAELARLTDEQRTPLQLASAQVVAPVTTMVTARPSELTPQVAIREAYPSLSRGMHEELLERIDPNRDWRVGPVERELLRDFVTRTAPHRDKFRLALERAEGGLGIDPAMGPLAELDFIEPLHLGCRVVGYTSVHHLADNDVTSALHSLTTMLKAAELLAREQHVACRLLAANCRADALRVLQLIVQHRHFNASHLDSVGARIDETLRQWPSDAQAWIGERASGLIAYELVRDGHYLALLDRDEVERLEKHHMLKTTARAVMGGVDEDQHFYLQSLRQLIDGCRLPFCERVPLLANIRRELSESESTQRYPIVAALLLDDFERVHQRQAEDLARCVAWNTALRIARGQQASSETPLNALSGKPYLATVEDQRVRISGVLLDTDEPVEVPLP